MVPGFWQQHVTVLHHRVIGVHHLRGLSNWLAVFATSHHWAPESTWRSIDTQHIQKAISSPKR